MIQTEPSRLVLPDAPANLSGPVKAWSAPVSIDTYAPMPADRNPMFLEKRVYQGSSGRVYPLPFIDRIAETKSPRLWEAIHLENEFVRLMILPELGGRIHVGWDKTNGYDFFYRQNVIKPALVGLAGPWISGGVEFNWPQHHRPSTFMKVDTTIESYSDGSATVWCSEHEPMNRMKGMHGVCLHPGSSLVEVKARLYNRTPFVQTFLWWANLATRVHEQYQSFFPADVTYVADHAKRAMSRFPACDGKYYGVDYAGRDRDGVPIDEAPARFAPQEALYRPNDLGWYANIPVPTSYMAMGSRESFFGGYDHAARAGVVHVADPHVAPGKKQWTWGNHDFGYAWDRNLTDTDGPYIELMAGVYTDNQPDFSFLHPGETRTFSQYWYPLREIGVPDKANLDAAISLVSQQGQLILKVHSPRTLGGVEFRLEHDGKLLGRWTSDLSPDQPLRFSVRSAIDATDDALRVTIRRNGKDLLSYAPRPKTDRPVPAAATEPASPQDVASIEQLYLIGVHLDQYRHATRLPELYWREALCREPTDSRCNTAMGIWHLRRGEFELARDHLAQAVATLTQLNPNPRDGEAHYHLGLALRFLGDETAAVDALAKSAWNYAWQAPAFYALAQLAMRRADWQQAIDYLRLALRANAEHSQARNLLTFCLRRAHQHDEADALNLATLALDPLDAQALHLRGRVIPSPDATIRFDLALEWAEAGIWGVATDILASIKRDDASGVGPIAWYARADAKAHLGEDDEARRVRLLAGQACTDYCFCSRLEEMQILQRVIAADSRDATAHYLLGNFLYDRRRHDEAIAHWERAVAINPANAIAWRNLGIGYFNVRHNPAAARDAYAKARDICPLDARLLYEQDQLLKRVGEAPKQRLSLLENEPDLVRQRDDLTVELCALYNATGQSERAMGLLHRRNFQPWEGGEGLALGQHVQTHLLLGHRALDAGRNADALELFQLALTSPPNLGEAKHLIANQSDIHFSIGVAADRLGQRDIARRHWNIAAAARGDFQQMSVRAFSEMTYYSALAMRALGDEAGAAVLLGQLARYAEALATQPAKIDYFATSLPTMLLFEDDLQARQNRLAMFLLAQAKLGLGQTNDATTLLERVLREDPNHVHVNALIQQAQRIMQATVA